MKDDKSGVRCVEGVVVEGEQIGRQFVSSFEVHGRAALGGGLVGQRTQCECPRDL